MHVCGMMGIPPCYTAVSSMTPDVLKRTPPECRFLVIVDQKRVVLAVATPLGESSSFQFDFKNRLPVGHYTMLAVITLNGNVMNADIRKIPISFRPLQKANGRYKAPPPSERNGHTFRDDIALPRSELRARKRCGTASGRRFNLFAALHAKGLRHYQRGKSSGRLLE
jgi:hypothetical protein